MSQFIDRRPNKNKSAVNRQRFLKRYKTQIKEAVKKAISTRSLTDSLEKGEQITIPSKDIREPHFSHGHGGKRETIYPGNKEFVTGDRVDRPQSGQGKGRGGSEASNEGEGEDDFVFQISREEFLELFFEDLALPDLVKKDMAKIPVYKYMRAGHTSDGIPTNLDLVRSFRNAMGRRMAMGSPYRKRLREAEAALEKAQAEKNVDAIALIEADIQFLKNKIATLPYIDTFDLRYRNRIKRPEPSTQAVMFCIMDVSGSMDEMKKDIAKRFFLLLYMFLKRNYDKIDLVFIRHHTAAKEVTEEEFFYSRETGGTVVSSALELLRDIVKTRYQKDSWNMYVAQASDGDNWNADSPYCANILTQDVLPNIQYFSYVEIMPRHHQSLWDAYLKVAESNPHFAMQTIDSAAEVFSVFRELFKRQSTWA
jgi:hypothetical protein